MDLLDFEQAELYFDEPISEEVEQQFGSFFAVTSKKS